MKLPPPVFLIVLGVACLPLASATSAAGSPVTKPSPFENFDRIDSDPQWEGVDNRPEPQYCRSVTQDFGYDSSRQAVGGQVSRSMIPAYYADAVGNLDLERPLSARGSFVLPSSRDGILFFGWFNSSVQGFRPANFVGM